MVATFGPTDASERVAEICAGNFTSARRFVRSGGTIVLGFWGVVKGLARRIRAIASKFGRHNSPRRAPTRGVPTCCLLSAFGPGKGTHKGRPYRLASLGGMPWKGRPQGAPLPVVFSRRFALERAPTRGAPTNCLLSAFCLEKGTHKGRPYQLSSLGVTP